MVPPIHGEHIELLRYVRAVQRATLASPGHTHTYTVVETSALASGAVDHWRAVLPQTVWVSQFSIPLIGGLYQAVHGYPILLALVLAVSLVSEFLLLRTLLMPLIRRVAKEA